MVDAIAPDELKYLKSETQKVLDVLQGDFSIDWLQDAKGDWYCIDLAEYDTSYRREGRTFF